MVIYEVNLTIEPEIFVQFQAWLKKHVAEIIQFPGFMQACILKQEKETKSAKEKLTVQYQLDNGDSLSRYLSELAPQMREDGIHLFQTKFSADRRIFEVQEIISK
ncbi:DUF4286 family protein [Legionella pneumophila]|uniref:DUF4286 family protein n=1 Tax=Legionella pneumophila TaxID=446 RepID=UPI000486C6C4|nr:DUF4286 family protein [Legionella pneumophila]RYW94668.1 DUF4286 family protein [Legionella pneumophila]STX98761.1 Uncharacterised protein [Legionella pneumophila]HAT1774096.1 DUF4286 family protein [Legionella pneumophila]HAT1776640.1 DUF4286 family protein [Legionella pneumophila]HAT2017129.1 DUF4286 family protein [Legionella pneumophila]